MDSTTSATSLIPTNLSEGDKRLKVQEISQKTGMPGHLRYLMTLKGDQDFISIHEWAARLCHALMIETGFFPVFQGPLDIPVQQALRLKDDVRIPTNVQKLTPANMFSDRGLYILKYKVILPELIDIKVTAEPDKADPSTGNLIDLDSSSKMEVDGQGDQDWVYRFSNDIAVTMLIMEDSLLITASYDPGDGGRSITHQITINIEEFLTTRVRVVPKRLRADQWLKKFDLNSTRFAGFFKSKFALYLMDTLDGIDYERRGLMCLPDLVIFKILRMLHVRTILHLGRTSAYFYDLVREDRLWQYLLKRDFQSSDFQPGPSENGGPSASEPAKKDFYEIYKQKYLTKYRGIHRLNTFPMRFPAELQRPRRFQIHPFLSVRF